MAVSLERRAGLPSQSSASPGDTRDLEWRFSQSFGDSSPIDEINDADMITTIKFDPQKGFVATGDKGGRVVIFEQRDGAFFFHTEFQSHTSEFDCLKSQEVEEKINTLCWAPRQCAGHFLLVANDNTIKLWKVLPKPIHDVSSFNLVSRCSSGLEVSELAFPIPTAEDMALLDPTHPPRPADVVPKEYLGQFEVPGQGLARIDLPKITQREVMLLALLHRLYAGAHTFHINSLSLSSDGESFLSSDDLRVNLWHIDHAETSFNVVDIKPESMEDLTEVITSTTFHPTDCAQFVYATSRGVLQLSDLRQHERVLAPTQSISYPEPEDSTGFFTEIISTPSSVAFSRDGTYLASRDYVYVRIWDMRNTSHPVSVLCVHEFLRPRFGELYMRDLIFDRFDVAFGPDSRHIMTGSYNNHLHIMTLDGSQVTTIEALSTGARPVVCQEPARLDDAPDTDAPPSFQSLRHDLLSSTYNPNQLNYDQRIQRCDWHPTENVVVLGANHMLYLYRA